MRIYNNNFYGNKISSYGIENGYVDYAALAKSFDAVLNNGIIEVMPEYWEQENGFVDNSDEIENLENYLEELGCTDETAAERADIEKQIEELEEAEQPREVYQWYIISESGADILKRLTDEYVYYNSELDMYIWGVTHFGTAWDYVLTDIKIEAA